MRRRSVLLAVPAGLLTLAGCGDDKSGSDKASPSKEPTSPTPSPAPSGKIVSGPVPPITSGSEFGDKPKIAKGTGKPSSTLAVKTVIKGDGPMTAKKDFLQVNYLGQIWSSAKVLDNSFDKKKPATFQLGAGQVIPGWDQALVDRKVGSRLELAVPPAYAYGKQGQPQAGIKGTDTLVFVIDIVNRFNGKSSAKGDKVAQSNIDLPKVSDNTDGKAPTITVPKKAAPKKLVSEYVIEGDGAEVKKSDALLVQYKGVLWTNGKQFDATYKRGELAQFSLQQVVRGWSQGLTGKKVGSRVLIVVPPELGYKNEAKPGIPANSTLVFSVDILAVL
ncbi:FKBP-type peptidyl-prolyl cis-trans isomerase [Streptomyces sp. NEAU-Y11]|uniref:FKBP-type peptidyl-prolyl cis-trans isomerase n=1 Tax=Streptomyces cucumeris TaxID=2962890 RepID=UPI0020C89322|nr:FKBP-type peptidyl-prolyl cis-trans isomerase [Streptomyces sp. NEAU-Y11]MCP9208786.1 FKBP-type peptidyl-prolyl cis-trans isomerase [Streptomyces sp. NEAU-Y11]